MVKAYLRYEPTSTLGVVSSGATICYHPDGAKLITAALESVKVWNSRTKELIKTLTPAAAAGVKAPEVTRVAVSPDGRQVAAGHQDGTIRLWNLEAGESEPPAAGHASGVSCLKFSRTGALLASGGQDTTVVVWDVTSVIPLHRLQGHLGQITGLAFLRDEAVLVSCSKDGYIRAWDLSSQHCFQTLGGQHGEVRSLDADPDQARLAVCYTSQTLELFECLAVEDENGPKGTPASTSGRDALRSLGGVQRSAEEAAAQVAFSHSGRLLACLGAGKAVDIFRVRDAAEAKHHMKRRIRRKRKKLAGDEPAADGEVQPASAAEEVVTAADELALLQVVRSKLKMNAVAFSPRRYEQDQAQLAAALGGNAIEVWKVGGEEASRESTLEAAGHRSGPRALALSADASLLLSAAESGAKVWNVRSGACLRHIACSSGLCAMFAPGSRHAVVGTKRGTIELLDVGAGEVICSEAAHSKPVWAATALPDGSGLVSGSADGEVKFWEWEAREAASSEGGVTGRTPGLKHTRSLKVQTDVLAARVTPDGRLLTLALLDSTVRVLFMDTLKLKGTLYGHKLPVLSLDVSSDSTLLVTASADKNIKFWGLDFNDCHKSIFAHGDSVMQVAFVPHTHYVFTVGKDGLLKYWDADRWELLLELRGHHAEVWCLAVSPLGDLVATGSADRSIRLWERTEEPFFAEEEREARIESLFDADQPNPHLKTPKDGAEGPAEAKSLTPGLRTPASRDAMGALADALEDAGREVQRLEEFAAAQKGKKTPQAAPPNPLLLGLSPAEFVLRALAGIRSADLEQALLLLPFNYALDLIGYLCFWLERGVKVELACRVAVLLGRLHHSQLAATPAARPALARTRTLLQTALAHKRDALGFNLAAVRHLQRLALEGRQGPVA